MAKPIGALKVFLGIDTAAWERGLRNANSGLGRFAAVAARTAAAAFAVAGSDGTGNGRRP